jgi:hypothetical protein
MTQLIASFRDLLVWQKSMDLAVRCYKTARRFPMQDHMVLGYQIRIRQHKQAQVWCLYPQACILVAASSWLAQAES